MAYLTPTVNRKDFSCPYCEAHASQTWYSLYGDNIAYNNGLPNVVEPDDEPDLESVRPGEREDLFEWFAKMKQGTVFFDNKAEHVTVSRIFNLSLSRCFSCKRLAVWLGPNLILPGKYSAEAPNEDLDEDIRYDIEEARSILDKSPRGAAALLRLAVQKMCKQLGEPGKNIDKDIQSLVEKGMDPHLQQAFDVVRVIGNEAVHPGSLDLRDDRETAIELISLINIVAQQLISNKKAIAALYARLPADKLKGIEARSKGVAKK